MADWHPETTMYGLSIAEHTEVIEFVRSSGGDPAAVDLVLSKAAALIAARARVELRHEILADLDRRCASKHLTDAARVWVSYSRSAVRVVADRVERDACLDFRVAAPNRATGGA